jgi:flagellar M-ring protein FliF
MPGLEALPQQLAAFWQRLSGAQRTAFVSVLLLAAGAATLVVNFARQPEWATLYANLAPEDASRIADELSSAQVPYQLAQAGSAIQVPVERVYDMRLELASKGLPSSGPVGLEVFEDEGLGMTPFQQRIRLRRALEGELSRTISRLAPIAWARVHVNLPDRSVFRRDQKEASAAVVVQLKAGRSLDAGEAAGIAQLVAGSVEGLEPRQVTILDAQGRVLARPHGDDGDALAAEALEVRRGLERELAARAQTLLDAALGAGRSVVTVSATIDTRRIEEKSQRVNPEESVLVSEQRSEETRSEAQPQAQGIPGTPSAVPPGLEAEAPAQPRSSESVTRETNNFDVSRTESHTLVPLGALQRLSVAVLVDGTYETPPPAAEGEVPAAPVYRERAPEELARLSEIVKKAVGFDEKRGDAIELQNLPFRSPLEGLALEEPPFWQNPDLLLLLPSLARGLVLVAGLALLVFLVIRPTLRVLASAQGVVVAGSGAAGGVGTSGTGAPALTAAQRDAAEISIQIGKDQAKNVADAMKQWLRE